MGFARPAASSDQAGLGELVYCGSIKVNWVYSDSPIQFLYFQYISRYGGSLNRNGACNGQTGDRDYSPDPGPEFA